MNMDTFKTFLRRAACLALLAGLIADRREALPAGGAFGVWTLVTKLNLALAAGLALPLLYATGLAMWLRGRGLSKT